MTTLNAFDYSWARPSPAAMRAAGITVVARYLHDSPKGLTRPEADALHAQGIGIVLNYEALSGNHLLGAGQGAADGAEARRLAAALGAPNVPIYFSCDREVSAGMVPTVLAYLNAADSAAHQSRCYAQYAVCEAFGRPAWQTLAWSYGRMSQHAVLYQYAIDQTFQGSAVDYDTVLDRSQLGAWWPAGSSESADSGSAIPIGETMSSTEYTQLAAQIAALTKLVQSIPVQVHNDIAGTMGRVKTILDVVSGDQIPVRSAQYLSGGLPLPGAGHNIPGSEAVITNAVKGQVDTAVQTLLAAIAAHTTTITAGGTVDLAPVTAELAALSKHLGVGTA